jgi:hypothetical protein
MHTERAEEHMSGFLIFAALVVGILVAVAFAVYGKTSPRKPGRVRPDAPPSAEEQERARGE